MVTLAHLVGRIIEWLAGLAEPPHRDLSRGMVAELHAITDPRERLGFGLGALVAVMRLTLIGSTSPGLVPKSAILRRQALPFAAAVTVLTACFLVLHAIHALPILRARSASAVTILEGIGLAVPFILAMTVPMAMYVAVLVAFKPRKAEGGPSVGVPHSRGLLFPVLGSSAVIAALMLVTNSEIVPRANARLVTALTGISSAARSDREMTVGQLRRAAKDALADQGQWGERMAVRYELEIQKKFALAVACIVLALVAAAVAIRFPNGRWRTTIISSGVVFLSYYFCLIAGESLANQQRISPFLGMWAANLLGVAVIAALMWKPGRSDRAEVFHLAR